MINSVKCHFLTLLTDSLFFDISIFLYKLIVTFVFTKRDIRIGNSSNTLFQHISQSNHNFDFNSAKMLIYIYIKDEFSKLSHSLITYIFVLAFIIFLFIWADPL